MKHVLFIYNRHAGKNKTWANLSDMINTMTEQDCLITAYPTQYRGDAGDAIVRWSSAFDQIVVAGGDGTLSEAIAGATRLPGAPSHRIHPRGHHQRLFQKPGPAPGQAHGAGRHRSHRRAPHP